MSGRFIYTRRRVPWRILKSLTFSAGCSETVTGQVVERTNRERHSNALMAHPDYRIALHKGPSLLRKLIIYGPCRRQSPATNMMQTCCEWGTAKKDRGN